MHHVPQMKIAHYECCTVQKRVAAFIDSSKRGRKRKLWKQFHSLMASNKHPSATPSQLPCKQSKTLRRYSVHNIGDLILPPLLKGWLRRKLLHEPRLKKNNRIYLKDFFTGKQTGSVVYTAARIMDFSQSFWGENNKIHFTMHWGYYVKINSKMLAKFNLICFTISIFFVIMYVLPSALHIVQFDRQVINGN